MAIASTARAGIWATQPVVGVAADYSSNPGLLDVPDTAETRGAVLLDAPTSYNGDAFKFSVLPSFRFSNTAGYASLDSDYEHLTVSSEFDTPRDTFVVSGALARDSSLYHDYLLNGSTGVRRDTATADVNWDSHVTERVDFDTDVNAMNVKYGESAGIATLVNYKYTSLTPSVVWLESERTKLTLSAAGGRYDSLNGEAQSTNANLQLGVARQLSEIWALTATAGYSRADNQINGDEEVLEFTPNGLEIVLIPVSLKTSQNGSIYSLNLTRQTEELQLSASASRQLLPTGFVFLSRQDSYKLAATYNQSDRLSMTGDLHRLEYKQPQGNGALLDLNLTILEISAAWQWTEHWTVSLTTSRVVEHYGSPSIPISNSEVSVELSRRFDWKSLQ
jgi:hypothetical protein